jgi:hypothetical protein
MNTNEVDPELSPLIEARIKKTRGLLVRQRRAVEITLGDLHHAIRDGMNNGMSPTWLAQLSGLHVSRIYQIDAKDDAELV